MIGQHGLAFIAWPNNGSHSRVSCIRFRNSVCALLPEAGAQCGSSARWDLCGGCRETGIPTATLSHFS